MCIRDRFSCGRDQVINDDVSVGTAADELRGALSTELDAGDGRLVEGELVGQFKSRHRQLIFRLLLI